MQRLCAGGERELTSVREITSADDKRRVVPAKAGIQFVFPYERNWVPAFAGTTVLHDFESNYYLTPGNPIVALTPALGPAKTRNPRAVAA
jgi:hypothetical protein